MRPGFPLSEVPSLNHVSVGKSCLWIKERGLPSSTVLTLMTLPQPKTKLDRWKMKDTESEFSGQ